MDTDIFVIIHFNRDN